MFTFPFCGFRVRAVETLPDSETAKGCDTEEPLLLEGFPEGGTSSRQDGRQPGHYLSAPQAALASSVTVRRNRRAPLPWREIALPACRQHKLDRHLEGKGRQISHENVQRLWKGDFCTGWPIPAKASWCLDFSCCVFSRFHIRVAATELTEQ